MFLHVVVHLCALLGQIFARWHKSVNLGMVLYIVGWIVSCAVIPFLVGEGD